jgi:FAD/FMN-containing dehydrogenase
VPTERQKEPNVTITTTRPNMTLELEALRARILGDLITRGSSEFDQARKTHDIMVDQRPFAIMRAETAADVAETVRFARNHGLAIAVRSGGHSLAQHSMRDDALVIDLSNMKRIGIDVISRIARVQAGATSGDLAELAKKHGLALTTGDTSSVGFGGLATGGGIGFMVRKHGLTIDNLLSAQVVLANGEIVTASESSYPDLFWAIRGGGGNFGIATEFTFRLAQVGQILGGDLMLPVSREAIRGYLDYSVAAPDGLSTIANLMYAPPVPFVPEEVVGTPVLSIIVCWTGSVEEGERALAPLRSLATPIVDSVRPMPYSDIYLSTAHQAAPHGFVIRSMFADDLSDEAIDVMIAAMRTSTSPFSLVHLRGLGGAMARVSNDATAFAHRDKRYLFAAIAVWLDASVDPSPHRAWAESLWQSVRHEGSGVYVNFLENEGVDRIRDAYPVDTLARLERVKQTYDPENLFRLNQNIDPCM